jgi:hypothetical protein
VTSIACPACGAHGPGDARFCEACGFDLVSGGPREEESGWEAVIAADREYFDALAPAGMRFPGDAPERVVALDGAEVRIGRRDAELDLPGDAAVSHAHAALVRREDGSYALVDLGSVNGTTVNGGAEAIAPRTPIPLADGDRIHVGAWTTITIRAVGRPTP